MDFKNKNLEEIYQSLLTDKEKLNTDELKKKYSSKEGLLTKAFSEIANIDKKDRGEYGREANELKNILCFVGHPVSVIHSLPDHPHDFVARK